MQELNYKYYLWNLINLWKVKEIEDIGSFPYEDFLFATNIKQLYHRWKTFQQFISNYI